MTRCTKISSAKVTKSTVSYGYWSHLLKKSLMENFSFYAVTPELEREGTKQNGLPIRVER